ncbi:hypothetical protein IUY40_13320, partial [Flavobacterium sp. ALJ2]|nr:hypothetical protein [Flavobacterium sp. ALJ2]
EAVAAGTTNELKLTEGKLISNVNGVSASVALDLKTTVSNALNGKDLTTTVNGVTGNVVDLTNAVKAAETVTKLEVNTLANGTLDYTDEETETHKLDITPLVKEPWFSTTTNKGATSNTEDIYTNGWVGIGYTEKSAVPNEKLRVNGTITTVNSYFADYVFEDYFKGFSDIKAEYKFKSLSEVDAYIRKNKHLPGITPITQLEKTAEGYAFNISELSIQLLEKTEELYLHVIEQDKQLDAKNNEIEELKASSKAMNERLEKLEKLILEKNNQ